MKKLTLGCSLLIAMLLSQSAAADSRHHRRGYSSGYGNHYSRGNPYHYGSSNRRHYGSRRGSSIGIYYGSGRNGGHRSSHNDEWAYFVGGAILGSIFTPKPAPVTRTREIVYVSQPATRPTPAPTGRRLLKDLEGNCFERIIDEAGNEMRVQLEAAACNF